MSIKKYSIQIAKGLSIAGIAVLSIATQLTDEFEIAKNIEIFSNVYREIHTYYVDELESEKVMRSGIRAMLSHLDPYTDYIAPEEVQRFESSISGRYGGVGASVVVVGQDPLVVEIYENSPAAQAGLRIGDVLLQANGKSLAGKTIAEISLELRGTPNSKTEVEVRRKGEPKNVKLTITRQEITLPNVPIATMLTPKTAYLNLSAFTENAGKNLQQALQQLRTDNNVQNIILDLRNNGGGLLNEAVNVSNLFLPKNQLVVQLKGRDIDNQHNYSTLNNPLDTNAQVVVLINNRSASAAEIVAGALQDLDRAVILGERSYGKGLVQTTRELAFGAKMKITTARYYIPSGRCIQSAAYKDGHPVAIADSLRAAFKTKAGRKVLDGGGISPDINTTNPEWQKLIQSLNSQYLIFDFATQYHQRNPNIPPAKDFKVTKQDFDAFMAFLKEKNYNYQTQTDKLLEELEKQAKAENLWETSQNEIQQIRQTLEAEKTALLQKYQTQITLALQSEIVRRYYFERGRLQNNLPNDPTIAQALQILDQPAEYKKILAK